jgi:hypothetical protein
MSRKFYKENIAVLPSIAFELEQPEGFTEITETQEIKRLYILQYSYRIEDGKEYVQDFTADTYIKVINGIYTDQEAFQLEAHIKELYQELNNGCWLTAQNTNTNLEIIGIYTQELKDEIQAKLNLYVLENY